MPPSQRFWSAGGAPEAPWGLGRPRRRPGGVPEAPRSPLGRRCKTMKNRGGLGGSGLERIFAPRRLRRRFLREKCPNMAPSWPPKPTKNRCKIGSKIDRKFGPFSKTIFLRFWSVFEAKMVPSSLQNRSPNRYLLRRPISRQMYVFPLGKRTSA